LLPVRTGTLADAAAKTVFREDKGIMTLSVQGMRFFSAAAGEYGILYL
jgi:hypothetical protein